MHQACSSSIVKFDETGKDELMEGRRAGPGA